MSAGLDQAPPPVDPAAAPGNGWSRLRAVVFEPVPRARVALLRVAVYVFVVVDMFWVGNDVFAHAEDSGAFYHPLRLESWLHLPVPSHLYAHVLAAVIIVGCVLAGSGRLPARLEGAAGYLVAAGFTVWVAIGMSYTKVDHDHFALIVAVWVLPSVGAARFGDRTRSEAAGWALLCIQIGCVATYFLSSIAKIRYGGWNWATGSTFVWAMSRRGTGLGRMLMEPPWILTVSQFAIMTVEFLSPALLILRGRARYAYVVALWGFHLSTYLTLRIHFLPLVVCLLAFLPLEQVIPAGRGPRRAAVQQSSSTG
jgi:hypothetical protein